MVVTNDDKVSCSGIARGADLHIGTEPFIVPRYAIPLGGYDVVLGVVFLRTMGPILWDVDDLCLAFWRTGRRIQWRSMGSSRRDIKSLSVHALQSTPNQCSRAVCFFFLPFFTE